MNISILGLGYVGVVTSVCLAECGHDITGNDILSDKVEMLNNSKSPIVEPKVQNLVNKGVMQKRLKASSSFEQSFKNHDAVMICVGTPSKDDGEVNLDSLLKVTNQLIDVIKITKEKPLLIFRSTIPPGTMEEIILQLFEQNLQHEEIPPIAYHPEFLREGSAVDDFYNSPEIIVAPVYGIEQDQLEKFFREIYKGININLRIVQTRTAEMIKYLNNTFHALKVAFGNEVGRIAKSYNVDTNELFEIFFADKKLNISTAYLKPGFAYGGSCLPKDVKALSSLAKKSNINVPIISGIEQSNSDHIEYAFRFIANSGKKKIGFLGLSFKSDTDDVRESPFVKLVEKCIGKGYEVIIHDYSINYQLLLGKNLAYLNQHIKHITKLMVQSPGDIVIEADLIILAHYSVQYLSLLQNINKPVIDLTGKFRKYNSPLNIVSLII